MTTATTTSVQPAAFLALLLSMNSWVFLTSISQRRTRHRKPDFQNI